ncbi:hypothetical protein [Altericista sp. CCNU0014]|uniref:hypothetical protein n=1 Tax=Altericista sp. CCNU0014 TaxID=3082949 RepID=UPI003850A994
MKSTRMLGSIAALGIISCSAVSAITTATAALADDWQSSDKRPAWSQRCDRDWDNEYCNPKTNTNRLEDWSGQERWQTVQDRWDDRNEDRWWNPNLNRWEYRNEDRSSDRNRFFRNRLLEGTYIPAYPERRRRIVLRRSERYPLTVVVSEDVRGTLRRGRTVLPRNSRIDGELVPVRGGYRFESDRVRFPNGRSERIWAVSQVIGLNNTYDRYDRSEANLSSGAAGILGAILGRPNSSSSVILGDVFDRYPNSRRDLVVLYPDRSLDLRLTRDFATDWRNF